VCKSTEYWYNEESDEFFGANGCAIAKGAFMSISSMSAYFVSMVLTLGFVTRPKLDEFTYDDASLPSWMASENGESAKAQAPPVPRRASEDDQERRSSIGYDWSRSAPSTIPSMDASRPIEEDYGMEHEEDFREDKKEEPIPAYPPTNNIPRRYDDMSTLTWDPGY